MSAVVRESAVVLLHDPSRLELRLIRLMCDGEVVVDELSCGRAAAGWLAAVLGRAGNLWLGADAHATFPADALSLQAASDDAGEPLILLRNVPRDPLSARCEAEMLALSPEAALSLASQLAGLDLR